MIAAIIGKAGSGKTTISKTISQNYDVYLEADAVVAAAYLDTETIDFFRNHEYLHKAVIHNSIEKSVLIQIILEHKTAKTDLEDYLYETYLLPVIKDCRANNKSLLVDGIVPRLLGEFDQIITVEVSKEVQQRNLLKRGVTPERMEQLINLQKEK